MHTDREAKSDILYMFAFVCQNVFYECVCVCVCACFVYLYVYVCVVCVYLQQSLAEPPHDAQVHLMGLWVSLLCVLILTLHDHIPAEETHNSNNPE